MGQREKAIREFIKVILKEWGYKMPILWFTKNGDNTYISPPPRIRLRLDVDLTTVLHELTHYRDEKEDLAMGPGLSMAGEINISALNIEALNEAITEEVANQLKGEYQKLWDDLVTSIPKQNAKT